MAARLVGGLAIGVASVLAPLYIAEISPRAIRGRLVSLNQMAIVTGILLAYFVNWLLSFAGPSSWRWMFASAAVPSVAFFVALLFVPESPRFLVEKGREAEALAVLTRVGGAERPAPSSREIRDTIAQEAGTLRELFEKRLRRPLGIAVFLAVFQQVTGINTVIYYGSLIFKEQVGGQSDSAAIGANVIIGTRELPDDDRRAVGDRPARPAAADDAGLRRHGGVALRARPALPLPAAAGGDDPAS